MHVSSYDMQCSHLAESFLSLEPGHSSQSVVEVDHQLRHSDNLQWRADERQYRHVANKQSSIARQIDIPTRTA